MRVAADKRIQRTDRSTAPFKRRSDAPIPDCGSVVERRNLQRQKELIERRVGFLSARALCRSKSKFGQRNGRDTHVSDRLAAQLLQRDRMFLDDRDAGVRIEHPFQGSESRCSVSLGCPRELMKSAGNLSRL